MMFLISFVSQLAFIFLRTVNVQQITRDRLLGSMVSGLFLSLLYIYTTMLGVNALNAGDYLSVIGYLVGGLAGQILAMRHRSILMFYKRVASPSDLV